MYSLSTSAIAAVVAATGTSGDPEGYSQTVARNLFPDVLPYVVGTPAVYGFAARNVRTLADNAPEAVLCLVINTAVPSGLKPSVAKDQRGATFPYVVPAARQNLAGARPGTAGRRDVRTPIPRQPPFPS